MTTCPKGPRAPPVSQPAVGNVHFRQQDHDNVGYYCLHCIVLLMAQLKDVLARHTMDQLKSLMRCLPESSPSGKKDDLISKIQQGLSGAGLHALWRLDDTR